MHINYCIVEPRYSSYARDQHKWRWLDFRVSFYVKDWSINSCTFGCYSEVHVAAIQRLVIAWLHCIDIQWSILLR